MSLQDSLTHFAGKSPAAKNRIDLLLEKLFADGADEDFTTLTLALNNPHLRPSVLTNALRKEYGKDVVTGHSVGDWRRRNLDATEVTGL